MRTISCALLALSFLTNPLGYPVLANAQNPPKVPDAIKAPDTQEVALVAHATGVQIYACSAGPDGKFVWILKGPDAELHDGRGALIGHHFAGPTWKLDDGSAITGKAIAKADSPEQDSVPWLLLNVVSHSGSGALSRVTTVQRVNTHGGAPPAGGCDASHHDQETKQTYTADYYFYAPGR
jgi:Protein of unknown function (DUF3455)